MAFQTRGAKGLAERVRNAIDQEANQMKLGEAATPPPEDGKVIQVTAAHIALSRKSKSPCSMIHNPIALAIVTALQKPGLYVGVWPEGKARIGEHCYPLPAEAVAADALWVKKMEMEPFTFVLPRRKVPC